MIMVVCDRVECDTAWTCTQCSVVGRFAAEHASYMHALQVGGQNRTRCGNWRGEQSVLCAIADHVHLCALLFDVLIRDARCGKLGWETTRERRATRDKSTVVGELVHIASHTCALVERPHARSTQTTISTYLYRNRVCDFTQHTTHNDATAQIDGWIGGWLRSVALVRVRKVQAALVCAYLAARTSFAHSHAQRQRRRQRRRA